MGLKKEIIDNLMKTMEPRHTNPFQLHEIAIPLILKNSTKSAIIVHAPTGHGKTAAFTVPILQVSNIYIDYTYYLCIPPPNLK